MKLDIIGLLIEFKEVDSKMDDYDTNIITNKNDIHSNLLKINLSNSGIYALQTKYDNAENNIADMENNISENLNLINSKSDIIDTNKKIFQKI